MTFKYKLLVLLQNSGKRKKEKEMHFYGNQSPSNIEQKDHLSLSSGIMGSCIKLIFNLEIIAFLHLFALSPIQQCLLMVFYMLDIVLGDAKVTKLIRQINSSMVIIYNTGLGIIEQGRISA